MSPEALRILVVDDEPAAQRLLVRILEKQGYNAEVASDVASATQMLAMHDFALVMTDLDMPGGSGLELIESLGSRRPAIATVLVTGRGSTEIASTALTSGAYGYLNKPFLRDEVEITVFNALRRRELELESEGQRERLEAMVRERTSELMESLVRLQDAQEELEKQSQLLLELEQMKSQFIQIVSHELRTPLTVIRGGVQTVMRAGDALDSEMRSNLLASVESNADALSRMINKILTASSIRRGTVEETQEPFSLDEVARQVAAVNESSSTPDRLVLQASPAAARGQRELVLDVVKDLVENALVYTSGRITLATWMIGDEAVLSVADEGEGIEPQLLQRLLDEPFTQGDSSTTREVGGLGLSLYLAKRIVEASGGRLDIDSGPNGANVSIHLPALAQNTSAPH